MNIFVTGASGFLGACFVKKMAENESINKIYCSCRTKPPKNKKIIWLKSDISDINDLNTLSIKDSIDKNSLDKDSIDKDSIEKNPVDIVVHFAAFLKYESKEMFESVNVKGTENVISFCKNNNIKRIIHCSTINVKLTKKGGYSASKAKAEELIKNSGLEYIIARPTLIYGPTDNGLNKMVASAKKFGIIPVFGSGRYLQQPIYIEELVSCFERLIFSDQTGAVFELGGEKPLSYIEMTDAISAALGKRVRPLKIPATPVLAVLSVIEALGIPFMLRREQIYQVNEDLVCENGVNGVNGVSGVSGENDANGVNGENVIAMDLLNVEMHSFKENLQKYIERL